MVKSFMRVMTVRFIDDKFIKHESREKNIFDITKEDLSNKSLLSMANMIVLKRNSEMAVIHISDYMLKSIKQREDDK